MYTRQSIYCEYDTWNILVSRINLMLLVTFKKSLAKCELMFVATFLWAINPAETLTSPSSYWELTHAIGWWKKLLYVSNFSCFLLILLIRWQKFVDSATVSFFSLLSCYFMLTLIGPMSSYTWQCFPLYQVQCQA